MIKKIQNPVKFWMKSCEKFEKVTQRPKNYLKNQKSSKNKKKSCLYIFASDLPLDKRCA